MYNKILKHIKALGKGTACWYGSGAQVLHADVLDF